MFTPPAATEIDDSLAVELWGRVINGFGSTNAVLQDRVKKEFDLNVAETETLLTLHRTSGHSAPMKDLAEAAAFSSGGFTKIADRLTERGLTDRVACSEDRRRTYLTLTDEGRRRAAALTAFVADVNREIFIGVLGEDRAREVAQAMTELYRANNPKSRQ